MATIDYLLIVVVLLSAIVGALRGLLREVIAVATWIIALWGAWQFGGLLEPYLGGVLTNSPALPWAARALVFIGLLLLGAAVGAIVGYFVRLSIFSGTDRFLGFLFGLLRGAVAIGVLFIIVQQLKIDQQPYWRGSTLLPYVESMAGMLRSIVGERWPAEIAPVASDAPMAPT